MGRQRKEVDSLRQMQKEGILTKRDRERLQSKSRKKQTELEITESINFANAQKFGNRYSKGSGKWESDQARKTFAKKMDRLGKLRQRINTHRLFRGLKPKSFPQFKYPGE